MTRVIITEFMDESEVSRLSSHHEVLYNPDLHSNINSLLDSITDTQALIIRNKTLVNRELIDASKDLRVIGRLGVGLDNIDTTYCREKGISIVIANGANTDSVAEYVVTGLLVLFRGIMDSTSRIINGEWPRGDFIGTEVKGKTLGIVGLGSIGRAVAQKVKLLGMRVVGTDVNIEKDDPVWGEFNVQYREFSDLVRISDAITMHVPLNNDTKGLFDDYALQNMRKGAILINTSRGGIVDEDALVKYLKNGHLGGAMLDVFESEPLTESRPFAGLPNLILTPHIAGVTVESNRRVSCMIVDQVMEHLK
ncbi:MAG: hydroxyacid dehydrogenase [Candidatus Poseidoniia archaeon]|jgi:(S)-sulfolactate dehydrogenase|nr:hydroxyacid dehydrogenase [Candidatus Poseidoniia archaeon]MDP7081911.1 hydroxyacid dehydrogenase [Candidatus Poseidoniia archaeon]MDP7255536.1 hydroxyacid dehydrogenase [Candidatus Poseidoniia archaeon]MDP7473553.1 hydroxyacid dehydrogenase [Candidatus Poseidoniia archaeon]MDP7538400.1 hydroxyacid dehydrogenase [Candidatus Poseidoniia archaeon]|tara:strand:- start:1002 stop:1925 length:924 start_codon:yes stop_codon:yes gene_type:complete